MSQRAPGIDPDGIEPDGIDGGMESRPDDRAVEELLAREEIRRLRTLYSHHIDGGDLDALVQLFAADAVCEFGEAYGGDWVGRTAIRAGYARFVREEIPPFSFLHTTTNGWIRFTAPDTAHGRWYLLDWSLFPGVEGPLAAVGIYDDVYRRIDGRWRIGRSRIDFLWPRRDVHPPRDQSDT